MTRGYVCPECGLQYDTISPSDAVVALKSYPRRFRELLMPVVDEQREPMLHRRPDESTWSAIEYTAHVADILATMDDIFRRMLAEHHPTLGFFDPDQRAAQERYNERDPERVLADVAAGAQRVADTLGRATPDDWSRTASFPWGARDLLTMVRNAVHEGSHHLRDAERVLRAVRGRPD